MFETYDKLIAMLGVATNNCKARHWTLKGVHFESWHLFLDEIYEKLSDALDNVAELVVQRGGIPVHSLTGYLKESAIPDMLTLGSWEQYVSQTAVELGMIIDYINRYDKEGVWDSGASSYLSELSNSLSHYRMFATQTLEDDRR